MPTRNPRPAAAIIAALLVVALSLGACDGDGAGTPGPEIERPAQSGEPRPMRIGFSTLPPDQSGEGYIRAFATAAQYGDIVLLQRTPPWEEFLPGSSVSRSTTENTRLERALLEQYSHLELLFAIDPTDGAVQRERIANLPPTVDQELGFNDLSLRRAFIGYVSYIVTNYEPEYLALGVEINMMAERNPAQFEAFVSLYNEAYDIAKGLRPEMKVFPTFQMEDLQGTLGRVHPPRWETFDRFAGRMDVLAVSTYPYLTDVRAANDLRPDYYTQLAEHWEGEIIIAEAAYPSKEAEGQVNIGTEEDQAFFLVRLLGDAEAAGFGAVIYLAALDPQFGSGGGTALLRDVGLRRNDGSNKIAWLVWEQFITRPLQE